MSLKHGLESSSPMQPPRKRRHIGSCASSSTIGTPKTPKSPFLYPYIPSTPIPYPSNPSDSPSNPFGRKKTLSLINSLPEPTGFGKHVPLRFQFIRPGDRRDKEGVYRVVQTPLSYTFQHLKSLISFLFGGDRRGVAKRLDFGGTAGKGKGRGHLFEVKRKLELYSPSYRPGGIKKGETTVRLSSAMDPYQYKDDWDFDELSDDEEDGDSGVDSDDVEADWRWEAEEELTLASVWHSGPDVKSGIVYHHSTSAASERAIQIHITINTMPIHRRKGRSNTPFVFDARGQVLLNPPPPKPSAPGSLDFDDLWDTDAEGDTDVEYENDQAEEDVKAVLSPELWNSPEDKFGRFLRSSAGLPSADLFDESEYHASSPAMSTPGLTLFSSPTKGSSSPIPVSPMSSPSKPFLNPRVSSLSSMSFLHSASDPYAGPKYTPAPGLVNRKRIGYISGRMERSKRKRSMRAEEEETASSAEEEAGKGEGDQLVDELAGE